MYFGLARNVYHTSIQCLSNGQFEYFSGFCIKYAACVCVFVYFVEKCRYLWATCVCMWFAWNIYLKKTFKKFIKYFDKTSMVYVRLQWIALAFFKLYMLRFIRIKSNEMIVVSTFSFLNEYARLSSNSVFDICNSVFSTVFIHNFDVSSPIFYPYWKATNVSTSQLFFIHFQN